MNKQEAIQAKQDIEKAFEEISDRMCALRLQYPQLGILTAYRFAQHSIIDTDDYDSEDNITSTGSTCYGNLETITAGMLHILHSIAVDENQPEVAESIVRSLTKSWEGMKKILHIDL